MPHDHERILFVHPQPEDPSATAGGTIATLIAAGESVTVASCTTRERGVADSAELEAALRELGVTDHRYVGATVADLVAVAAEVGATAVVSCSSPDGDRGPDASQVHAAARTAAATLGVAFFEPVAAGSPDADVVVDIEPVAERKRAALATGHGGHVQTLGLVESFRRAHIAAPRRRYRDRPVATKLLVALLALAAGAVVGALTTAIHQANATVAGVSAPWGLVLALLAATALIVGLRVVTGSRAVPALGALGLMGMTALLAAPTMGGSVVVPANPAGAIWTFAPAAVTLFVLAWPNLDRRTVTANTQRAAG